MKINKVAILGMGALGIMYGHLIAGANGYENVEFLVDQERYERYRQNPVDCNGEPCPFKIQIAEQASPADLVMVAVKYTGLKSALPLLANSIGPDTIIMSVMNGISSEEIIGEMYGMDHMIYTVARGMDAMKFGTHLTYSQMGTLLIGGTDDAMMERVNSVDAYFEEIGMPRQIEADILRAMWSKYMLNVGVNQTCMVFGCTYQDVWREGKERDTMLSAMREVIMIANEMDIALSEKDVEEYDAIIHTLLPTGTPSMGQDRIAKRKSEVEMFAGTVIDYGKKFGIEVPVNAWLYDQVQVIEAQY